MQTSNSGDPAGASDRGKTPKVRSVSYPSYAIMPCVDLTGKIAKEFTDIVFTPRQDISNFLRLSGSGLLMQLSTCVQYGLLLMKSNEGYKPTELFKKISRPLPDENVNDFLKECLQKPELYKKLIVDLKDKQLPSVSGLANILDRNYGVKGNASTIASKVFFKNLEALNLISGNSFSFDKKIDDVELFEAEDEGNGVGNNVNTSQENEQQPKLYLLNPPPTPKKQEDLSEFIEIPIPLKDGRKAKLLMPEGYSDEDIAKVHKVITGYLP